MNNDTTEEQRRVAVVGGGISGLAAAYHLTRAGVNVDVIEREPRFGGRFGVSELGGRAVMLGGKNIGRRYCAFRAFTAALGRHPYEEFGINSSRVEEGEVLTFDSARASRSVRNALRGGAPRDVTRLLGLAARVRARETNRFLGSPLFTRLADRHDSAPLSSHFGPDITRRLLRPMTVRMNGAEPDEVFLGTFGTNLALVLDTFDQLVHGIQPVLETLEQGVTARKGCHADELLVEHGSVAGLRVAENGAPAAARRYDAVVAATSAHAAAGLLRGALPELSRRLDEVRYFPTTVALVEYDRPVFDANIRALAMDDGPCSNAGAYGRHDRHIVRYTFSGRDARAPDPSAEQIDAWLGEGEERLRRHVPASRGARRVAEVTRHWSKGYCGYLPFHGRFLSEARSQVAAVPGLALAGDYLWGVSLEACFRSGVHAAEKVLAEAPT